MKKTAAKNGGIELDKNKDEIRKVEEVVEELMERAETPIETVDVTDDEKMTKVEGDYGADEIQVLEGLEGLEEASDAAWTYGIGDIIEKAESIPRYVIMANPGTAVLTKAAYKAFDEIGYTDPDSAGKIFVNDMEKYTLRADKKAASLKKLMLEELDAEEVLMSGSGPTMVAYYKDIDKAGKGLATLAEMATKDASIRAWLTDTGK